MLETNDLPCCLYQVQVKEVGSKSAGYDILPSQETKIF